MSENRSSYNATQAIGTMNTVPFDLSDWERNFILRLRQAAQAQQMIVCDPDAKCWWVTGRIECNKGTELPFRI
jgi:hypothetical protein